MVIGGIDYGKQLITTNGKHDSNKSYKRLSIVYKGGASYISKVGVPAGISIADEDYWQPFFNLSEGVLLDLKEYKESLHKEIDALIEAVTTTVNSNNDTVTTKVKEIVERFTSHQTNVSQSVNEVLGQISDLTNSVEKRFKDVNKTIGIVDKNHSEITKLQSAELESYKLEVKDMLEKAVANLEAKLEKFATVDQVEISPKALKAYAAANAESKPTRLVVAKDVDRDGLTTSEVSVGYEVYVIETKLTYILDEIDVLTNEKVWHLEKSSTIEATYFDELDGELDEVTAERAIADENGLPFIEGYVRKSDVKNFVEDLFNAKFVEFMPQIYKGSITPEMLSPAVIQLLGNKNISNLPDDLVLGVTGDRRLTLCEAKVNPNNFRAYGHKVLRENIIECRNILEQYMIEDANTIYYVYLEYDLDGKTIDIPNGSSLFWRGGKFNNGTIRIAGGNLRHPLFVGENLTVVDKTK